MFRIIDGGYVVQSQSSSINWEQTFREYIPRIYNFFLYRLCNRMVAEDLTAATFERAWKSHRRYRENLGAFSTWIFTIAQRVMADHFRREHHEISLDVIELFIDTETSVEDASQHQQNLAHLRKLLYMLPPRDQELIALRYGAELTSRQIAQLTNLSETNVNTILSRAIQKLRKSLEVTL